MGSFYPVVTGTRTYRKGEKSLSSVDLPDYKIRGSLGSGAGSKIYEAVELRTGETYAIKQISRNSSDDDRFIAQAENEFAISSQFDHPSLRRSFSIHRVRKRLQLRELLVVMEYVDGVSIETARPTRLNTFINLMQHVALGLRAMHDRGYLHTDIKPSNILLSREGKVKIIDFGQSCKLHHRKERIQGTPDYIAPEQVRRLPLDQRTDVFNLGATMYWLLTSECYPTAIRGIDTNGGHSLVSSDRPLAPIELNDKIPIALSKLVMECCLDVPAGRPADMKQVIERLEVVKKLWNKHRDTVRTQRRSDSASAGDTKRNADEGSAGEIA